MPKFIIEVSHEDNPLACARAAKILHESGSHYLTNADYGCLDGDHRCWMTIEIGSKEEAKALLPPSMRMKAKIVQLNKFTLDKIDEILAHHQIGNNDSKNSY